MIISLQQNTEIVKSLHNFHFSFYVVIIMKRNIAKNYYFIYYLIRAFFDVKATLNVL